ncbi:uncharacterized protein PRCAT00005976001 [Priceomyces carsonii]|uniref:uncharacterized protein n=1 Tax=Priceomyces carsonii TaxID=28549 RepID=UPI002EDAFF8F|nr:unnamed protein product [Priceomyces carsonii]
MYNPTKLDSSYELGFSDSKNFTFESNTTISDLCTPRSLSVVELIGSGDIQFMQRTNIWSTSFKGRGESLSTPISSPRLDDSEILTAQKLNTYAPIERLSVSNIAIKRAGILKSRASDSSTMSLSLSGNNSGSSNHKPISNPNSFSSLKTFKSSKGIPFVVPEQSKFFVIKSYSAADIISSFAHEIWTSTEFGNRRLDRAYVEASQNGGKVFLFFLVNSSGKFCAVAEMKNRIDFTRTSNIWVEQTRWKGIFPLEWLLIKEIPNRFFQCLRIATNENKPVTHSRDTQEIPFDVAMSMMKIFCSFKSM